MPLNKIVYRQLAGDAFATINAAIDLINLHNTEIAQLKTTSSGKRTISTAAPSGVPVDGEEWIVV